MRCGIEKRGYGMFPATFEYHAPATLREALTLMG
jgi:hypothetical protein